MAATDKISGHEGTFTYDSTEMYITTFSLSVAGSTKDVTDSSCSTWKEKIPSGFKEWSGTVEGFVIDGTATETVGAAAATGIFLAETGVTWTGSCIITSKDISLTVDGGDAVKISLSVEGTGALTESNT